MKVLKSTGAAVAAVSVLVAAMSTLCIMPSASAEPLSEQQPSETTATSTNPGCIVGNLKTMLLLSSDVVEDTANGRNGYWYIADNKLCLVSTSDEGYAVTCRLPEGDACRIDFSGTGGSYDNISLSSSAPYDVSILAETNQGVQNLSFCKELFSPWDSPDELIDGYLPPVQDFSGSPNIGAYFDGYDHLPADGWTQIYSTTFTLSGKGTLTVDTFGVTNLWILNIPADLPAASGSRATYGDVDENGTADMRDAKLLFQVAAGELSPSGQASRFGSHGDITMPDALHLFQFLSGSGTGI